MTSPQRPQRFDPAEMFNPDDWIYCPDCQSCGVGGCCPYFCDTCKDRHDGDDAEGGESPRNLGNRRALSPEERPR
jgi:hypothetical protein